MKPQSQRQLRVNEQIKQVISEIFIRGNLPLLYDVSITVSEVRTSPDLKNATIYVMPFASNNSEVIELLNSSAADIRYELGKKTTLKFTPKLYFTVDLSFDNAQKISELLDNND